MKTVRIKPSILSGKILVPSSKSMGHREIICAGLASGESLVDNVSISKDIEATVRCLQALGVEISKAESKFDKRNAFLIRSTGKLRAAQNSADCGESGSTLRFFIPLAATLGEAFSFIGHGKLVSRPLQAYYDIFDSQNLKYETSKGQLPFTVNGRLKPGNYRLPGNVSSQYVTGLLFALPLLESNSKIEIEGKLESASYIDMTLSCLRNYGINIVNNNYKCFEIAGKQKYISHNSIVEGDWSQAAFWIVAAAMGSSISCLGADENSLQGDKIVISILQKMGIEFNFEDGISVSRTKASGIKIDASDCPDIVPILSVMASVSEGVTKIINAGRLRIKECDRLAAITSELGKLGADITELPEGLIIKGHPEGLKGGVTADAWNDHRIAMSLAIAATKCKESVTITGADSVNKSYPSFWEDYSALSGRIEVIE